MALPLNQSNTNQEGCTPISSNCVIWQGPDIPCIQLCKGDTISDVTAKLAHELCDLLTQLNISTFDLTCFNPVCPTLDNFHDLIQFILNEICKIEDCIFEPCEPGCTGRKCKIGDTTPTGCPDCIVTIAPCFYFLDPKGDTITTMQLADYVTAIGNKICDLVTQIDIIEQTLIDLDARLTIVEACCNGPIDPARISGPLIPNYTSSCLISPIPAGGIPIQDLVANLEQAFCELRAATGLPSDIFLAIIKQCSGLDLAPSLAFPGVNMGSLPGWITQANYNDQADAVNNIWLTICDLRAAVANIQETCCPKGCDGLIIDMTATYSAGAITFFFTGTAPAGFVDCAPGGNLVTITDDFGGTYITYVSVIPYLNGPGFILNIATSPLNLTSNFHISLMGCWENPSTDTTCERQLVFDLINTTSCPVLLLTPTQTTVAYNFNNIIATPITYDVELWNAAGTVLLSSQSTVNPPPGPVIGTFIGAFITPGTTYKVRICMIVGISTTCCPFGATTTLPDACPAVTNVSAMGTP
jgi:hypothetical protein